VIVFTKTRGIEIAIRGGGHATSGASSTEGGICIDLSKLRKVIVNPDTKTVTAQGGALWADVDKAAEEHGLAVVGGTVNTTGVGGLTLGGGYGYLVGQYGLVIDNLLEVKLVLADGKTVTASRHKNSQLFWAIRGAGASFGAVLSFTFQAYAMRTPVWGGALVIGISELQKVVAFANDLFLVSAFRNHQLPFIIHFCRSEVQSDTA
jgi:FAD/FMN-containing dehydrogenase